MKKIMMILPMCAMLAYCSTTNTTDGEMDTAGSNTTMTSESVGSETVNADATVTTDATASTTTTTESPVTTTETTGTVDATASASADTVPAIERVEANMSASLGTHGQTPEKTEPVNVRSSATARAGYNMNSNYSVNNPWTPYTRNEVVEVPVDNSPATGSWSVNLTPEIAAIWRIDTASFNNYYAGVKPEANWLYPSGTYMSGSATVNTNDESMNTDPSASVSGSVSGSVSTDSAASTTSEGSDASTETEGSATVNASATNSASTSTSVGADQSNLALITYTDKSGAQRTWNNQYFIAANGNQYQMPRFNLYIQNGSFTGFTGCNNISGRLILEGEHGLRFENTTPSTAIDCPGGLDEKAFLEMLATVDSYTTENGQLQLKAGDRIVLTLNQSQVDASLQNGSLNKTENNTDATTPATQEGTDGKSEAPVNGTQPESTDAQRPEEQKVPDGDGTQHPDHPNQPQDAPTQTDDTNNSNNSSDDQQPQQDQLPEGQ